MSPLPARRGAPRDLELEAGARAHFDDPLYYSDAYDEHVEDVVYYVALARERGAVLEHGIGNGRVALPIARAGAQVTGIDQSRPMLDHLRAKLKAEPPEVRRRVRLRQGDFRSTRLGRRFPLVICPFNAALHLYTRVDVERWLARTREHLEPKGELVFDISMPLPSDLARNPNVPYHSAPFEHPTAGRVRYREYFDYDKVRQILFVSMHFDPVKRPGRKARSEPEGAGGFMMPLAQRQFYPCEMEALLHYNGYEVTALYGDFDRGPLVQSSEVMVWHARPRRTTR